jgi:hypothetical protein
MKETYEDRLMRLVTALMNHSNDRPKARRFKNEVVALVQEQAKRIVRLETELDHAYEES